MWNTRNSTENHRAREGKLKEEKSERKTNHETKKTNKENVVCSQGQVFLASEERDPDLKKREIPVLTRLTFHQLHQNLADHVLFPTDTLGGDDFSAINVLFL